ncbi:MAG TPA: hypothetical protein VJL80_01010 [Aeromicrobium sp.]|nr:hypothetical protein [Aeromicrobium sp.]HKY56603.1 hypothetical protein [Aeromicrobium sp.]
MQLADPGTSPVGGAALDQVIGLTAGAGVITLVLLFIAWQHRTHRIEWFQKLGDVTGRTFGTTSWGALPVIFIAGSLLTAYLGFMWDVSLHAGRGRDDGPLANPAHYFILFGLFFLFMAGMSAVVFPRGDAKPSPSAVRITGQWFAPVSGIYLAGCGLYALIGFPLDDVWHRLFGQDVTLWGPTHLMLIGGAGLSTLGIILFQRENEISGQAGAASAPTWLRTIMLSTSFGASLIGLSVFLGEFDFGVAQFRMVFHPMLTALAVAIPLVAARLFVGPGAAFFAACFYLGVRGVVSFLVTDVFGQAHYVFALALGSALLIELLGATKLRHKPLWFGAIGGLLIGTVGTAIEGVWTHFVYPFGWPQDMWAEGLAMTVPVAVGAGMCGALFALALKGTLPGKNVSVPIILLTLLAISGATANGLNATVPENARATVALQEVGMPGQPEVIAKVQLEPADLIDANPTYVAILSWQGGGEGVISDRLRRTGPNTWESTKPMPVHGNWKTLLRLQDGRMLAAVPIFLPADAALDAPELPASASFTRDVVPEISILQRERNLDVPAWSWGVANLVVLLCSFAVIAGLCVTTSRLARGVSESKREVEMTST